MIYDMEMAKRIAYLAELAECNEADGFKFAKLGSYWEAKYHKGKVQGIKEAVQKMGYKEDFDIMRQKLKNNNHATH